MGASEDIAYEIGQLRRDGVGPVTADIDLYIDEDSGKALQRMASALEQSVALQATQNDLLAELVMDHRPRPRRRSDRIPDILIAVLVLYLLVIFAIQIYQAVHGE
jgi:hypothetical protein